MCPREERLLPIILASQPNDSKKNPLRHRVFQFIYFAFTFPFVTIKYIVLYATQTHTGRSSRNTR